MLKKHFPKMDQISVVEVADKGRGEMTTGVTLVCINVTSLFLVFTSTQPTFTS